MKTIKISLFTFLLILLSSCSSDNENSEVDRAMVVGTWNLEAFNYSGSTSGNFEGVDLSSDYSGEARNIDATLSFNEDNTFNFEGNYDVVLETEGMTQTVPMNNVSSTGNWRMEGDYIISSAAIGQVQGQGVQGPEEGRMRVSEVTANRMVLDIDQENNVNQNGMELNMTTIGRYVLTR